MRRNATINDYVVLARALPATLVEELSVVSCQSRVTWLRSPQGACFCGSCEDLWQHYSFHWCSRGTGLLATKRHKTHKWNKRIGRESTAICAPIRDNRISESTVRDMVGRSSAALPHHRGRIRSSDPTSPVVQGARSDFPDGRRWQIDGRFRHRKSVARGCACSRGNPWCDPHFDIAESAQRNPAQLNPVATWPVRPVPS